MEVDDGLKKAKAGSALRYTIYGLAQPQTILARRRIFLTIFEYLHQQHHHENLRDRKKPLHFTQTNQGEPTQGTLSVTAARTS